MWTTKKIGVVLGLPSPQDKLIHSFQFDSRAVKPGDCFIALPGEVLDGNNFIDDAHARGAVCVIGQKNADFLVPDSYAALNKLGVYAKDHSPAKRIAITGSVGKTTTTSFLAQILQQKHTVVAPQKSFNNHIGVPLTMTGLSDKTEFGVFEIGTNHPGEMRPLADLVRPHIAIITKIGTAHIGHFGSKKNIALEKAQILYALTDDGVGIVPDDEFLEIYQASGKKLVIIKEDEKEDLPTIPKRLHGNVAAVKKAAELLGVRDFDLSKLQALQGRGLVYPYVINGKKVTIVDDAYNAAFDAFLASLEDLSHMTGRKILVVGDMGEVGEFAKEYHEKIVLKINSVKDVAHVIPSGQFISEALKIMQYSHDNAILRIRDVVEEGDILFFKGSNASGVGKILGQL
ncbi:MAG: UDP-N-acetylmuramoyl-tripeptide--D-alanyl-D-alanine ligase [Pseudomonadota bacterium]